MSKYQGTREAHNSLKDLNDSGENTAIAIERMADDFAFGYDEDVGRDTYLSNPNEKKNAAQGVPKEYVEHSRAEREHGQYVRKAYISGERGYEISLSNPNEEKNATQGVPKGYVEHSRALSDHGRCVRKAYISGDLEKRPRKARYALTPSQEAKQTNMIFAALGR